MIRFSLLGIPVRVHPVFWVLAILLGFSAFGGTALAVWVGVVFASVLNHEMGHAVVARFAGQQPSILLHGMGGVTTFRPTALMTPGRQVAVTLAGPAFGFTLAGLAWLVFHYSSLGDADGLVRVALVSLIWANLIWSIFNLVPIRGLDGGQAVAGIVDIVAPKRSHWITEAVYIVAGVAAIVYGLVAGFPILAFIAVLFTFGGYFFGNQPAPAADGNGGRPTASDEPVPSPRPEADPGDPQLPL